MKRYTASFRITFTTDAKSKKDAREQFMMKVLNHTNLMNPGMNIEISDNVFLNWNKKIVEELPF